MKRASAPLPTNQAMDEIYNVLILPKAQKQLIYLYSESKAECCRNGKAGMEIGTSRENDLKAVLREHLGEDFITDIDNRLIADCEYLNEKISIKHIGGPVYSGSIKAKWTSDQNRAEEFIAQMTAEDHEVSHHLLIVYIDEFKNKITIFFVTSDSISESLKKLGTEAFLTRTGENNRGVEYSRKMVREILANKYFSIELNNVKLTEGLGPVQRRRELLKSKNF